jgi:hypothetical protein
MSNPFSAPTPYTILAAGREQLTHLSYIHEGMWPDIPTEANMAAWQEVVEKLNALSVAALEKVYEVVINIVDHLVTLGDSVSSWMQSHCLKICGGLLYNAQAADVLTTYYSSKDILLQLTAHKEILESLQSYDFPDLAKQAMADSVFFIDPHVAQYYVSVTTRIYDCAALLPEVFFDQADIWLKKINSFSDPRSLQSFTLNLESEWSEWYKTVAVELCAADGQTPDFLGRYDTEIIPMVGEGWPQILLDEPPISLPPGYTYGLELEYYRPSGFESKKLQEYLLLTYNLLDWQFSRDGSFKPITDYTGEELVSPIMQQQDTQQIVFIARVLNALNCMVVPPTAVHFHVGVGDWNIDHELARAKQVILNYQSIQQRLDFLGKELTHDYPHDHDWRNKVSAANNMHELIYITQPKGRRRAHVNLYSILERGTYEFRQHPGCLNENQLKAWSEFCAWLVDFSATSEFDPLRSSKLTCAVEKLGHSGEYPSQKPPNSRPTLAL